jgi:hypothetical protein
MDKDVFPLPASETPSGRERVHPEIARILVDVTIA